MPGDALELALVQDELDALVILGSLIGLTSQERVRYEELGDREVELLQARGRDSLVGAAILWRPSVRRPRGGGPAHGHSGPWTYGKVAVVTDRTAEFG